MATEAQKAYDNGNTPANPILHSDGSYWLGLSKREYFAGLAMQGLLANPHPEVIKGPDIEKSAIAIADALLLELSKQP